MAAILILPLAACGGGSGSASGSSTTYRFVTPVLNSTRTYSETIIDNLNYTIEAGFSDTVTAVNPDGSYVMLSQDPNHETLIVNGTNYSIVTETGQYNSSGQETSYTYVATDGSLVMCTYDPHGDGPDFPLSIGSMWMLGFTFACGSQTPVTYTQDGTVVDLESVTVPAGTYSALKLESTVTWTDLQGTTRTQTITNWRDVSTMISVKQEISIAYSGALPATGYAVSREILLQTTS
ncbi:MAG TPA: hypothetical protein VHN17_06235 [Steroidobacteraceae bacterium]|nr:hypothetical protein [Steroidobacteraceae bacterium]